jgi:hypothetical protein
MARVECRPALLLLAAGLSAQAPAQGQAPSGASAPRATYAPVATRADTAPADETGRVPVWVDLDLPELASVPKAQGSEREALRAKIQAQQEEVMARLRDLGAIEQSRVQQVRNALAVRLPSAQLEAARRIPGVRAVRGVHHNNRHPLVRGD